MVHFWLLLLPFAAPTWIWRSSSLTFWALWVLITGGNFDYNLVTENYSWWQIPNWWFFVQWPFQCQVFVWTDEIVVLFPVLLLKPSLAPLLSHDSLLSAVRAFRTITTREDVEVESKELKNDFHPSLSFSFLQDTIWPCFLALIHCYTGLLLINVTCS